MDNDANRVAVFGRERPHLLAVAFRILRSEADAQDVVQEAWIRYARTGDEHIDNVPAWLATVVTRLCLDLLRRSRERPQETVEVPETAAPADNPEQVALLAGEVSTAIAVVLEELTPPQRVALVLHDVFGAPFDEIGYVLGTTPGSAKKLASRARARVRRPAGGAADHATERRVVGAFLRAARQGDIDGLVKVLHPEVTRTADPQALPAGTAQRVHGARTVVAETRALRSNAQRARLAEINGRPGIVVPGEHGPRIALTFHIVDERIVHYDVVADPRRLAQLRITDSSEPSC